MKNKLVFIFLLIVLFTSCRKEIVENEKVINSSKELKVPTDFRWETMKKVEANLKFVTGLNDTVTNANIKIYAGTKQLNKLIFEGVTNDNGIIDSLSFSIGNQYSTVEVMYDQESTIVPINNGTISKIITLTTYVKSKSKSNDNSVYYPSFGNYATLAFEDNWPYLGDFDFNDLALDYNVIVKTNSNGMVISAKYTLIPRGVGAAYKNGFGFTFDKFHPACNDFVEQSNIASVRRKIGNKNEVLEPEVGQLHPTYIIINPIADSISYNWNTQLNKPYNKNETIVVTIQFKSNHSVSHFDFPFSNPFIYINGNRSREVHLPYHNATSKGTTYQIPANSDAGLNYKSKTGLTWAIDVEEKFQYPLEGVDILNAYLQFEQWATTPGSTLEWWDASKVENNLYPIY